MALVFSARNQLRAKVKSVKLGAVMAEVIVELPGGQEIVSAITRASAESLNLKQGDSVVAIIKSTEVMVGVER
jgi:molybdate transport system regulatory protein